MKRLLTASLVLLVIAACGGDGRVIELDLGDSGSTIRLGSEDRIELVLQANPTTGFTWLVDHADGLEQVGAATHDPESDLVGAPGLTTFVFEPAGPGEGELMLVYRRQWEDVAPEATFVVDFVVGA